MAMPLKLTPSVHKAIIESIRNGAYMESAGPAAGVDATSVSNWLTRGRDPDETDPRFAKFLRDFERAEAEAENESAKVLAKNEDWRARSEWLKRRFPSRWGDRSTQEVTGPGGGPIQTEVKGVALTDVLDFARRAGAAPSLDD